MEKFKLVQQPLLIKNKGLKMVKEIIIENKKIFICEKCGLGYLTIKLAEECEAYCSKNHACSLKIIKNAVYFPKAH